MKTYWLKRGSFANQYTLAYCEGAEEEKRAAADGYERFTRREAEKLCAAENYRARYDGAFSGYADSVILPYGYPVNERDWRNDPFMIRHGYIVERV